VRVSKGRSRYPLREFVRASERAPYSAPQTASASALMSALMNVVSMDRIRSGEACSSCSDRKRAGSITWGAVIA
jgi:hypothetical protein